MLEDDWRQGMQHIILMTPESRLLWTVLIRLIRHECMHSSGLYMGTLTLHVVTPPDHRMAAKRYSRAQK